ncbi:transmembrane protein 98-like [Oratosquilla oratoria]|uniref:transmembrane protein 98-like n=1 Tax=Oratosquilla oratoria TaxID=337810 RepID=UPI003F75D5DB
MEVVEPIVAVALGVLAAVFLASLVALVLVCYRRAVNNNPSLFSNLETRPEVRLINGGDVWSEVELDDVKLAPQIDKILKDTQWVDDATGLIPHCLAILKLCHQLTEHLVTTTMSPMQKDRLSEIVDVTRRLSPRIDAVARAMYPPLDPRLLEARCSALVLTTTLLAWHTRAYTPKATHHRAFQEPLAEMDAHLGVLREAAMAYETYRGMFTEDTTREGAEC